MAMDDKEFLQDILWNEMFKQIQKRKKKSIRARVGDDQLQKYLGSCLIVAITKSYLNIVRKLIEEENVDPNTEDDDGFTSIMIAVQKEDVAVLEYFLSLSDKVNINARAKNGHGWTALLMACFQGSEDVVRVLISSPLLDVNLTNANDNATPLEIACGSGFEAVVSILLSHKDIQVNKASARQLTPLSTACFNGHEGIVSKLLNHRDIDVNKADSLMHTPLEIACVGGHLEVVKLLLGHRDIHINHHELIIAANGGHVAIVEYFLSLSDKVNINKQDKNGWTALMKACSEGFKEVVRVLLDNPLIDVNITSNDGSFAALHLACARDKDNNNKTIVSMLLDHENIQVNKADAAGTTPLIIACYQGHLWLLRLLLTREDIDVNAQYQNKNTALMIACSRGHAKIVRILLEQKDIDINLSNLHGATALSLSCEKNQPVIISMLLEREDLQRTVRNLEDTMNFVMKRQVDKKEISTVIEEAVNRNQPDVAIWLLKFEESWNLESSFYQALLAKAVKERHIVLVDYLNNQKLVEQVNQLDINKHTQGLFSPSNDTGEKNKENININIEDNNVKEKDNFADAKSTKKNRGFCGNSSCNVQSVHRCSRCRKVAYCSTQCQEEHWPLHQENCRPRTRRKKSVLEEVD